MEQRSQGTGKKKGEGAMIYQVISFVLSIIGFAYGVILKDSFGIITGVVFFLAFTLSHFASLSKLNRLSKEIAEMKATVGNDGTLKMKMESYDKKLEAIETQLKFYGMGRE